MKVIDLFSGLGGFSAAFVDRGHDVIRYDNDPQFAEVPHTVIKDVRELTAKDLEGADIVLASPPCTAFSCAGAWKYWPDNRPLPEVQEHLDLVKHALVIIHDADPEYWILENPQGKLKLLIGPPVVTTYWGAWGMEYLKPTHLWGKIPVIEWPSAPRLEPMRESTHGKHQGIQANTRDLEKYHRNKFGYDAPRAPALRSLIPYSFSEALCIAVEAGRGRQTILPEYHGNHSQITTQLQGVESNNE